MRIVDITPVAAMERGEKGSWALTLEPGEVLSSHDLLIALIDEHDHSPEEADSFEGTALGALHSIAAKRQLALQTTGAA